MKALLTVIAACHITLQVSSESFCITNRQVFSTEIHTFFSPFFCGPIIFHLHAHKEDPMLTAVLPILSIHLLSPLAMVTAKEAEGIVGKGCSFGSKLKRQEGLVGHHS